MLCCVCVCVLYVCAYYICVYYIGESYNEDSIHSFTQYPKPYFRYIEKVTELFEISSDIVSQDVSQNLMILIAEGAGESDLDPASTEPSADANTLLRQHAVTLYANLLSTKPSSKRLPCLLVETMAWVLGEYGYLSDQYTLDEILDKLCSLIRCGWYDSRLSPSTRWIVVTGITKLVAQAGTRPPRAARVIDDFSRIDTSF